MPDYPSSLDHMLAAWNERDPGLIRSHLDKALAADIRFVDPSIDLQGIDAFEDNVRTVQAQLPGAVYSRTSQVDAQHGFYRYHWAIYLGEERAVEGFEVSEVDKEGYIRQVIGFFGALN